MWLVFANLFVVFTLGASDSLDRVVFIDEDVSTSVVPLVTERIATTSADCKKGMILYHGDDVSSEGICDCIARYLYYQANDTCYEAYRQGPCPPQHYFVLPPNEVVPKCERNSCLEDGLVSFNNTCYKMSSVVGPCPLAQYLMVNSTTFQLECETSNVGELHIIDVPANRCPNGSRRNALGQCRKMI